MMPRFGDWLPQLLIDTFTSITSHPGSPPFPITPQYAPFRFLDLPAEIRLIIYHLLLGQNKRITVWQSTFSTDLTIIKGKQKDRSRLLARLFQHGDHVNAHAQICRVSKQLHNEAVPVLYDSIWFHPATSRQAVHISTMVPQRRLSQSPVRRLEVGFELRSMPYSAPGSVTEWERMRSLECNVLRRFPNLQELRVGKLGPGDGRWSLVHFKRARLVVKMLPRLSQLYLRDRDGSGDVRFTVPDAKIEKDEVVCDLESIAMRTTL